MPIRYAGAGEDVYLRSFADPTKKAKHILWGDWLNVVGEQGDFFDVTWGKNTNGKPMHYWVRKDQTQEERPLQLIFLDVGQGDSCVLVTPGTPEQERVIVIDAGEGDNTWRYIKWRFGKFAQPVKFHAAVITHPDQDHYGGFMPLFDEPQLSFERLYHNGIAERVGADRFAELGPSDAIGRFLCELPATHAAIAALYGDAARRGRKRYPALLHTALSSGRVGQVQMLSTATATPQDGRAWMPGFAPADGLPCTIEVLGPVVEPAPDGAPRLRWFGEAIGSNGRDVGKTKNGHSVLLRLSYNGFTLLFGGDLNRPAEDFLLRHYGGVGAAAPLADAVPGARARLRSAVMKSCHHGAADVTDEFLLAVQPFAFVVSSGDDEPHVHPRPDLLGRLGRFGRGSAPLLLCTELLRSSREREDRLLLTRLRRLDKEVEQALVGGTDPSAARQQRAAVQNSLARRNVQVYGAINLRSDGRLVMIGFMMEQPRGKKHWHSYWFERRADGEFDPL